MVPRVRHNSQDDEIRALERRIGSGNYDAADPMRLHALVMRSRGEPLPKHVEVALDSILPTWEDLVRIGTDGYAARDFHSAREAAVTVLETFGDDVAAMIVQFLDPPEIYPRDNVADGLATVIKRDLLGLYRDDLTIAIRARCQREHPGRRPRRR